MVLNSICKKWLGGLDQYTQNSGLHPQDCAIPPIQRCLQLVHKFKVILQYTASLQPAWTP